MVTGQPPQSDSPVPGAPPRAVRLSVVIPAYNEAGRIGRSLHQLRDYVARRRRAEAGQDFSAEVIVVDDASTDATAEIARSFDRDPLRVRVIRLPARRGKGAAVRAGVLAAAGEMILMADADLSTPVHEIDKLAGHLAAGADAAIGSRHLPESIIGARRTRTRRAMELLFRAVRRRLMLRDIRDTQCGFKLFRREAAVRAFDALVCEGFAFDCEVLARIAAGGGRIVEVGVVWCDDHDSRVRPVRDGLAMLADLIRIRWRLRGP